MIVSHSHKFVFVEYPQTGCSAIAQELMQNYGGERKLYKHARYREFLKKAESEEKDYFSFSTIRNPMDIVVSKYFKYKTNHKNYIDKKIVHGRLRRLMRGVERARRDYIQSRDADFGEFFLKYYKLPYSSWSLVNHHELDFIMRFEHLADSFEQALLAMGVEPVRRLPLFNKTGEKKKHFTEYYDTPEVRRRAVKVFGPYMKQWGYEFPEEWPEAQETNGDDSTYHLINSFRKIYWKFLR